MIFLSDYCMACEGLSVADPICKTVCYQTSDCYTLLYTTSEGDLLVNKVGPDLSHTFSPKLQTSAFADRAARWYSHPQCFRYAIF